ncbi:hypothetical protein B0J14DRAFT_59621 [Halenospora varia]|nr:hypothetical protein B0J14DRAFT_59621 [Halenospora varia]
MLSLPQRLLSRHSHTNAPSNNRPTVPEARTGNAQRAFSSGSGESYSTPSRSPQPNLQAVSGNQGNYSYNQSFTITPASQRNEDASFGNPASLPSLSMSSSGMAQFPNPNQVLPSIELPPLRSTNIAGSSSSASSNTLPSIMPSSSEGNRVGSGNAQTIKGFMAINKNQSNINVNNSQNQPPHLPNSLLLPSNTKGDSLRGFTNSQGSTSTSQGSTIQGSMASKSINSTSLQPSSSCTTPNHSLTQSPFDNSFNNTFNSSSMASKTAKKRKSVEAEENAGSKKLKVDKKRAAKVKETKPEQAKEKIGQDIWMRILEFTPPSFLKKARLINKEFKNTVDQFDSIFVNCRKENYGWDMPPPPPGLTERQYSDLLGGKGCQEPGCSNKKATRTYWSWSKRWCADCWEANIEREDRILKSRQNQYGRNTVTKLLECIPVAVHDSFVKPHDYTETVESQSRGPPRLYKCYLTKDIDQIIKDYEALTPPPYKEDPNHTPAEKAAAQAAHKVLMDELEEKRNEFFAAGKTKNDEHMAKVIKIETAIRTKRLQERKPKDDARNGRKELFTKRAKEDLPHISTEFVQSCKAYKAATRIYRDAGTERGWRALKPKIEKEWEDFNANPNKNPSDSPALSDNNAGEEDGAEDLDVGQASDNMDIDMGFAERHRHHITHRNPNSYLSNSHVFPRVNNLNRQATGQFGNANIDYLAQLGYGQVQQPGPQPAQHAHQHAHNHTHQHSHQPSHQPSHQLTQHHSQQFASPFAALPFPSRPMGPSGFMQNNHLPRPMGHPSNSTYHQNPSYGGMNGYPRQVPGPSSLGPSPSTHIPVNSLLRPSTPGSAPRRNPFE